VTRLDIEGKPLTINATSRASFWQSANEQKMWRELSAWFAKAKKLEPAPIPCAITVVPWVKKEGRANLPDAGACVISAKGAIDGLIDAGVLVNDSPEYVDSITFRAPHFSDRDALSFVIEAVDAS
jgi:hypothetical protein